MLTPSQTDLQREAKNTPPLILNVVEGRANAEMYLAKMYGLGYSLEQWHIQAVPTEGFAAGANDRFTLLLVHASVVKMQQEAIK